MKTLKMFAMTAVLIALLAPAVAVRAEDSQPQTTPQTVLDCVKTAVEKRENALIAAVGAFSQAMTSAHSVRKDALLSAWGTADKTARAQAIKDAWTAYRNAKKAARDSFNAERKNIWTTFSTERRACKAPATGENPGADNL